MNHNLLQNKFHLPSVLSGGFWMVGKIILLSSIAGIVIFSGSVYVWAQNYDGMLPPRTQINDIMVGGMDPISAAELLQTRVDELLATGIPIVVDGNEKTLSLATVTSSDSIEDAHFDIEHTIETLMSQHDENSLRNAFNMFQSLLSPQQVSVPVSIEAERITESILADFPDAQTLSISASFLIENQNDEWIVTVLEGSPGTEFQWNDFFEQLTLQLSQLSSAAIQLELKPQSPRVSKTQALAQTDAATDALLAAPYTIEYEDDSWTLSDEELAQMLQPGSDGVIQIEQEQFNQWLEEILQTVNQDPRDARLTIEEGRVIDFVESLEGRVLDQEQLYADLVDDINAAEQESAIILAVDVTKPTITTADVNDLGIDEKLGVGTSSYRGSPSNRRGNIQNGVDLLNGLLIAPGETFSLIDALSPFTYQNGYLPELVIKGDKIEPEIGGGLCQIGTTTFRAVMNSGLHVEERRNHSLVVSYYNDPSNGNPGTDATIYDPAPDFKFTNDTDHYVLFEAENLTETQELQFTFWGTSDGRSGSYTPPVIHRWIPVGATQYIETTDLEPGVEQCQSAHVGADASFTYSVIQPDGEVEQTVFESHYRPLPRICLVGVEEQVEEETEIEATDDSESEQDTEKSED